MLDLEVQYPETGSVDLPDPASFTRWIRAALGERSTGLTIRLVDTAEMAALNQQYRGKNYATNVLSFPLEFPLETGIPYIGDIVICPEVVAREALDQGKPIEAHYAHLTVHGVLHLLGYDHETEEEAVEMETLETRILAGLGYPDPYQSIDD
ncbi:MAG: rRNA maturation RNase YbeY [Gammaproteobacteria bacterium]|nr:rRNA maturation RNase YbeY [Gammaproteobacteria bacterium]